MAEQVGGLNIDDDHALAEAFRIANKLDVPVAAHAEDRATLKNAIEELKRSNHNDIEAFLEAHSEGVESKAVKRLLDIAKQTCARVHYCHLSTRNGLESIIGGKNSGLRITCEATPHHLLLSASDLKRIGTLAVTMPPVREAAHIDALWKGVKEGWVDTVGSDHAPHKLEEKENPNVWNVKVGISGLETALPLLLTEVNRGRISIANVVRLMAEKPAEIFKLEGKGSLKEGNRADLTVVDLKRKYKVDASKFHSKAKFSPFDGWNVQGKPVKTFVNGQLVMDDGEIVAEAGSGQVIRRKRF
jgi:dihydroorotase